MNILIYFTIFGLKIVEDAISTLRLIVVANGKKGLGSILHFINSLIWVFVAATVIINIEKDPIKVAFFALGALVGSYVGSYIEEKIALGSNAVTVEIDKNRSALIIKEIKKARFKVIVMSKDDNKELLLITSSRKKTNNVIDIIRLFDKDAVILTEKVKISSPGSN